MPPVSDEVKGLVGEDGKITGHLTVGECLRLAKTLKDTSILPASCQKYLEENSNAKKAYEGGTSSMAARGAVAKSTKSRASHAQLQRRWTSRRDPLKHAEKKK
eukprot:78134_1